MKLLCPNCKIDQQEHLKSVSPGYRPAFNDLVVCGSCAHISVVWPVSAIDPSLELRLLKQQEYDGLSEVEQADIHFAVKAILARLKQGNSRIELPPWYKHNGHSRS